MATFKSNSYGGRYLQLVITEGVDVKNNKNKLSWVFSSIGGSSDYYSVAPTSIKIDGVEVYSIGATSYTTGKFPAARGSVSGTLEIDYPTNGKYGDIEVVFSTRVYYGTAVDYGGTMTLTNIDRTAPTVTLSISDITYNSFKLSATSSVTADRWDYSIDDGKTWNNFSTTEGTTASKTVTGLSPNTTYKVYVRARKKSNYVYGKSSVKSVKTLGASSLNSVVDIFADAKIVNIDFNITVFNAGFYHKITIYDGNTAVLTTDVFTKTAGQSDAQITLTDAQRETLLTYMESKKEFSAIISLATYSDSACKTQVGTASAKTCSILTSKELSAPIFNNFTFEDTNAVTKDLIGQNGVFLQNYSMLKIECEKAIAQNFAKIASYSVSIGNVSVTNTEPSVYVGGVSSVGTLDIVVTCTDSRGYPTVVKKTVEILKYAKPKITGHTRRKDEIEAIVQLDFSGSFSSIMPDGITEKNYIADITYQYKKTSESNDEFSEPVSILEGVTIRNTFISYENLELTELDTDFSFDIVVTVTDALGILTQYDLGLLLLRANPYLTLLKRNAEFDFPRIGVFNPKPQFPFDCNALANFAEGILISGQSLANYIVEKGTEGMWTYEKYADGTAKCWGTVTTEDTSFSSAWGSLYYGSVNCKAVNYPFEFVERPQEIVTARTETYAVLVYAETGGINTTGKTGNYDACRPNATSSPVNVYYDFYVIGKWK